MSGATHADPDRLSSAIFVAARASDRLGPVVSLLAARPATEEALVIGPTREVADELARRIARERGGASFGLARTTLLRLASDLAEPALARAGLVAASAAAREAIARRIVATMSTATPWPSPTTGPSFARTLAATLDELRLDLIEPAALRARAARLAEESPEDGSRAAEMNALAAALARWPEELAASRLCDAAQVHLEAIAALEGGARLPLAVALVDVAIERTLGASLVRALARRPGASLVASIPRDDVTMRAALADGDIAVTVVAPQRTSRLAAVQEGLFREPRPLEADDGSVVFGGAPGEAREAVEIARHVLAAARRGVPLDAIAIATRSRESASALEAALRRAGLPFWFESGTRRPHPAGRALLALLACAASGLSASRFAEFLSFGEARVDDEATKRRGRWERLLREAAIFGGRDRWGRRLAGLRAEKEAGAADLARAEPESGRVVALGDDVLAIDALERFAGPILDVLAALPARAPYATWATELEPLARLALAEPDAVVDALDPLRGADASLEGTLVEVLEVLDPELRWLERPRPARRHGRVLVTTPEGLRGRSLRVVLIPGLVERSFPVPVRDDPLLSDVDRAAISPVLARRIDRSARERLLLSIAVGAAEDALVATFPRIESRTGRARVPSLHALEILRARDGVLPDLRTLGRPPGALAASRLAWPAPSTPEAAVDEVEHDLATLLDLFAAPRAATVRGAARYMLEENPHLARVMRSRFARWELRYLTPWDGARIGSPAARAWLARERLTERPYAPTALARFAACPYQFFLRSVLRLAETRAPQPVERLDAATRGVLVHRALARLTAEMDRRGWLAGEAAPPPEHLDEARALAREITRAVAAEARDTFAPRVVTVFDGEVDELAADVEGFVVATFREAPWVPHRSDLGFGLAGDAAADPRSTAEPARLPRPDSEHPFLLRGAIDAVERHAFTGELRVTDFKTGTDDTPRTFVIGRGEILQPVLYAMALDAHGAALGTEGTVGSGRLSFASARGGFREKSVFFDQGAKRAGMLVLETIDAAIDRGILPALPRKGACEGCAFRGACGPDEERRARIKDDRKDALVRGELDALRGRT